MHIIEARNVHEAFHLGLASIDVLGVLRDSRNGPVMVFPEPVTTVYEKPSERVIFHPGRDANPFFHFMESLWMVAGRRDVDWVAQFNSGMTNYSDDGVTLHGAYGYRWRGWFEDGANVGAEGRIDQLETIANLLIQNQDDRRVVLQMWDTSYDLALPGKDFPCNLTATFRINPYGALDMTVFNRSNDMIWGAYGANAVHFSFLQEVMASWVGVPIGKYWQVSTNFHAYADVLAEKRGELCPDPYRIPGDQVNPYNIVNTHIDTWMGELQMFMEEGPVLGYTDPFFRKVAIPMLLCWQAWKNKDNPDHLADAIIIADTIAAKDWRLACIEWLLRRRK